MNFGYLVTSWLVFANHVNLANFKSKIVKMEKVLNPLTNRLITKGGKLYKNLVKRNIIAKIYSPPFTQLPFDILLLIFQELSKETIYNFISSNKILRQRCQNERMKQFLKTKANYEFKLDIKDQNIFITSYHRDDGRAKEGKFISHNGKNYLIIKIEKEVCWAIEFHLNKAEIIDLEFENKKYKSWEEFRKEKKNGEGKICLNYKGDLKKYYLILNIWVFENFPEFDISRQPFGLKYPGYSDGEISKLHPPIFQSNTVVYY